MPLPNAKRLYYPYPDAQQFPDVARNFEQSRIWANGLPFFPTYDYLVHPVASQTYTLTTFESITGSFYDEYGATSTTAYPFSGTNVRNGGAANGLRFPFQKQEDWTAISIKLSMSAYYDPAVNLSSEVLLIWKLGYVETNSTGTAGYDDLPPSTSPGLLADGEFYAGGHRFNVVGTFGVDSTVHIPFAPRTTFLPPHPRGWNFVELKIATSRSAIVIDQNDWINVVIQEVLPRPAAFEGNIPFFT